MAEIVSPLIRVKDLLMSTVLQLLLKEFNDDDVSHLPPSQPKAGDVYVSEPLNACEKGNY